MRFIDLFAGIGGFHYGLQKANYHKSQPSKREPKERRDWASGFRKSRVHNRRNSAFCCVWANEWDKYSASVYRKQFPETPLSTADIRLVKADDIPDADMLCAGFPCQPFSIAGRRKGFEEARGTLFYEICRIARDKGIKTLFLENVKGLLSAQDKSAFAEILYCLDELGYDCEWQVLNSKNFGVPQNRERVFIVGYSRSSGADSRQIFPLRTYNQEDDIAHREKQRSGAGVWNSDSQEGRNSLCLEGKGQEVWGTGNSGREPEVKFEKGRNLMQIGTIGNDSEATRVYSAEGIARTLKDGGGLGAKTGLYAISTSGRKWGREGRIMKGQANTIETGKGGDGQSSQTRVMIGTKIRRLMPVECERLQGYPNNFTEFGIDEKGNKIAISDSQRYKMCGNAVTTNVITTIGRKLLEGGAEDA